MRINRRDFLKAVAVSAGALGLKASGLLQVQEALAGMGDTPVIWLEGQGCSGCSVSLLNSIEYGTIDQVLLNSINLEFHPTLMAAAGDFAISATDLVTPKYEDIWEMADQWLEEGTGLSKDLNGDGIVNYLDYYLQSKKGYILVIEGSIPIGSDGLFCDIADNLTMIDALDKFSQNAGLIVAVGTCASYGGVSGAVNNPTGALSVQEALNHIGSSKTAVNIPGCPTHPDWLVGTLVSVITGQPLPLDAHNRPTAYFGESKKIHEDGHCPYKGEDEIEVLGEKGCLKKLGCKGPKTFADCYSRKWNSGAAGVAGVNWCIGAGSPCVGCTEPNFPDGDFSPFYTLLPPVGGGSEDPGTGTDLNVTKTEYKIDAQEIRVEATSNDQPNDVIVVEGYGAMTWKATDLKYELRVSPIVDPIDPITITLNGTISETHALSYTNDYHGDGITIKKAEYKTGDQEIVIEAYSIGQPETNLYLEGYGPMTWDNSKVKYIYKTKPIGPPAATVTVTSDLGGIDTRNVDFKL